MPAIKFEVIGMFQSATIQGSGEVSLSWIHSFGD